MERFGDSLNFKLRGKNCATFYSETGYVTAMAVMLKKLCLAIIKLLLLKSHAFFSLQLKINRMVPFTVTFEILHNSLLTLIIGAQNLS